MASCKDETGLLQNSVILKVLFCCKIKAQICFCVGYLKYHILFYHPARYHFLIWQSSEFLCLSEVLLQNGISFVLVNGCCWLWCSWRFLCFSFQQFSAFELLWPPFYMVPLVVISSDCILEVLHSLTLSEAKMLECCPWDQGVFPRKRQFLQIIIFLGNSTGTTSLPWKVHQHEEASVC